MLLLSWETVKDIQALQEDVSREEQPLFLILRRCESSNTGQRGLDIRIILEKS